MELNDKIYVAGHNGMLGSAIVRSLKKQGYNNIIGRTSKELDLRDQIQVNEFFEKEKPDVVILAAAKVGGIEANRTNLTDFLIENLQIETNVIKAAYNNNVKNFAFLGSTCIYPKMAPQPLKEEYLFSGPLEPTNEGYGIAKLAGLKACEYINKEHDLNYISIMPTNLYGINDNFHPTNSHVIAGIMRKLHLAKENNEPYVEIWGTGKAYREFLYVDDAADAVVFLLNNYHDNTFVNIGTGKDVTIKELAETMKKIVGYNGELRFNANKPDGVMRRCLDINKIRSLGWEPKISLEKGLTTMYEWYVENIDIVKKER